jgi:OCT family organic cation transporter-like MFS transporter 4/5
MIIGMTTSGVFLVSYVLAMEMVGPKYRVVAGTLCQYYYTFGMFAMCLVAYFLNDNWHLLQVKVILTVVTVVTQFIKQLVRIVIFKDFFFIM